MPISVTNQDYGRIHLVADSRRQPLLASSVMGMLLFVLIEAMLFAGMISAYSIIRSGAMIWPPPDQPRLPIEETAINTAALMLSGLLLFVAHRRFRRDRARARTPLLLSMLLGAVFVVFQGVEWVALIREGFTLTSSSQGSFFYLIVGMHALHAVAALGVLAYVALRLQRGWLASSQLAAAEVFWYFVVGMWPIIYLVVYL
ncbi:MAG: cytochrome c oxidase subunit 3 [Myxococcales bacterium]|nr:cytochrome c oxidase subunit 3 [Myxococcales bacterium]